MEPLYEIKPIKTTNNESDDLFVEHCRTCFQPVSDDNSTKIFDKTSEYSKKLQEMLKFTLTEINLNFYRDAVICFDCQKDLEISFDFIKNWTQIDEKFFYWAKYRTINVAIRQEHDYTSLNGKTIDTEVPTIIDDTPTITTNNDQDNIKIDTVTITGSNIKVLKMMKIKKLTKLAKILTVDGTIIKNKERVPPKKRLCEICGKSCLPHTLKKHLLTHDKNHVGKKADQLAQCHVCGKQLKQRTLLGHLRYTHGVNVLQKYQCEHCGKTFLLRARYRKHLLVHGPLQYPCDICGKVLKYKKSLENHKNFYHGDAKYICDQCPRRYCQMKDLKRHKFRIHELHLPTNNGRRGMCPFVSDIKVTENGQYECVKCGKLFMKRSNCWVHVRRHDRTFECDLCQKKLKSRFTLKRHYQILHLDYCHYYCQFCGKRYYKEIELKNHMMRIHNVSSDDQQFM